MKTLILYATKHGAAEDIAKRIAAQIGDADLYNLKQENIPQLGDYDCVIVGSSVYAGAFRKEAKAFLARNADQLCEKKLGLFICAMSENNEDEVLKANVPEEVVKAATAARTLGGAFDPKKGNFFERLIMKAVTKQSGSISTISDEKISKFVEAMKS